MPRAVTRAGAVAGASFRESARGTRPVDIKFMMAMFIRSALVIVVAS